MLIDTYTAPKTRKMSSRMIGLWRDPVVKPTWKRYTTFTGYNEKDGMAAPFYYVMFKPEDHWAATPYEVRRVWLMIDEDGNPCGQGRVATAMRLKWFRTSDEAKAYLEELFRKKLSR